LSPKQDVRKNEWLDALQTKNKGSQRKEERGKRSRPKIFGRRESNPVLLLHETGENIQ
jgi:hypothetical protein